MRAPRWLPQLPGTTTGLPGGVSCTGAQSGQLALDAVMPNLAALRNMSYNFANFFAAATNCTPDRACMMTGLYTPQTCMLVTDDPPHNSKYPYPPALQPYMQGGAQQGFATIGDVLTRSAALTSANATYDCVWIGKWHLSDNPERVPDRLRLHARPERAFRLWIQ